jgi:hypothetical protein
MKHRGGLDFDHDCSATVAADSECLQLAFANAKFCSHFNVNPPVCKFGCRPDCFQLVRQTPYPLRSLTSHLHSTNAAQRASVLVYLPIGWLSW